jgi:hypothetical protein
LIMETKCIRIRPAIGRTRSFEKIKESKMEAPQPENKTNHKINIQAIKRPWKKPVLMCGKKISLFDVQGFPPDDFS